MPNAFNNTVSTGTKLCINKAIHVLLIHGFGTLTLNLIEMPFNAFANRADPDQAALIRAA